MFLIATNWSAFFANVGQFILAFSILVVLHELGHFLTARWFGCRVDKFYLFFNPGFSLWKKKIGETEYGLGWIPLGGYVKIAGMIDESMDKEQLNQPAQPWEFRSKPAWQRLIIMLGGVTINFILALVLFAMILFVWGEERLPVIVDSISPKVEYKTGELQRGDTLTGVNNEYFHYYNEFDSIKKKYKSQVVTLKVVRNGDTAQVKVKLKDDGSVGFFPKDPLKLFGTEKIQYTFFQAIPAGINYGVERLGDYITGIRLLFTSKEHKVSDNLGSLSSIGKTFGGSWDWQRFWTMTALFSIILAFMNILPIPALDAGHALFTLIEMITGRKPSDRFMEYAQMVGMVLLLGLMLYAFGLDIWRLFK